MINSHGCRIKKEETQKDEISHKFGTKKRVFPNAGQQNAVLPL